LISSSALLPLLEPARGLVLLDVRWRLGADDPRGEYDASHIPGAIYVDLEGELSGPANERAGRHPLPSPEAVEKAAARWGVRPDSLVVVYDDNGGMSAARAWWLLRWIGHERVHVLDGGLGAWRAADGPLTAAETQSPAVAPGATSGRRVAVYCGSGVTAAHEVLALEVAGVRASLFPASWSGWIADAERPVATGDG
jgi:thiosulfate/3-mercaptopyruvate sulfurtransferase